MKKLQKHIPVYKENLLPDIVEELSDPSSYQTVYHRAHHDMPMPSIDKMTLIMELLRTVLFPGYYGHSEMKPDTMKYYIGSTLDNIFRLLSEQIMRGFCFSCAQDDRFDCADCEIRARDLTMTFLSRLTHVRHMLSTDVQAAYEGDPAAKSPGEAIFCYPSIKAVTNQRVAHELYLLEIPLIPRIITEMAHSGTGIDLHPGARIGERFFIDHGTGVVIGETSIIGSNVRLYQGVTLGAKSFPMDEKGRPIKGIPRHPIVEDDVIIYAGATILGRITIGQGSEIGGNVWVTSDVSPHSKVLQTRFQTSQFEEGAGI